MMKFNRFMMGVALMAVALSGCSNEEQLSLDGTADARTPLAISVTNAGLTKAGGVVTGSQFGDGVSLGLFLTKEDGSSPYDEPYNNIKYTSSTSGGNQVWTASTPILLTGTKAKVYAYYPYNSTYNDITSIPIDVTQNQDVMWATPYSGAYNASPTATLPMNHALSVIRLSLSKGDYSGVGSIESITIQGDCMAKTGTLNVKTGAVTPTDAGAEIDLGATATLTDAAQTVEQLVIPTGSGSIQVTIQMDDKTFEATSSAAITPEKSKAYKFGLAFSDSKLTMSTVTIVPITEVTAEDMKPIVDSGSAWSKFTTENDGVYGIDADGNPLTYAEALAATSLSGVAIVMYGRALQISNSHLVNQYWGSTGVNIAGIPDLTAVGGGLTGSYGYLPQYNGSYASATSRIKQTYDQWPNTPNTALADTAGWSNTEALITAHSGKTPSSSYIGAATADFRNGPKNQGYTDWFVPACGQWAYMFRKNIQINELLGKCGGTSLQSSDPHWSSSEYSVSSAWNGVAHSCCVSESGKNYTGYVRFLRDLH